MLSCNPGSVLKMITRSETSTNQSGSIMNRSGSAAQSGSEMNRSGSLRTYLRKSKLRWQVNDCLFKSKTRSCRDYSIKSNFFLFFSDKDKNWQLDHCLVEPRISWIVWGNVKFRFAGNRLIWMTSWLFTDLPDSPQSSSNWSFLCFFVLREGFEAARHAPLSACHQLGIDLVIG